MKKIFTLAACATLCTSTLLADIKIGDTTYDTLSAAITAATDETTVIEISGLVEISDRITISSKATIEGVDAEAAIRMTNRGKLAFNMGNGANFTFKNISFDGNGKVWDTTSFIEAGANGTFIFDNVTFKNIKMLRKNNGATDGIIHLKSQGKAIIKNVTFTDCEMQQEGRGLISNNSDVSNQSTALQIEGDNSTASFFLYGGKGITVTENGITNSTKMPVYFNDNYTSGTTAVYNCTDLDKFAFNCPAGFAVEIKDNNLQYLAQSYIANVNNNGVKSWEALLEALTEAENTVSLNEDITVPSRWLISTANFNATFKSATDETVNIIRGALSNNTNVLIELQNNANNAMLRFENINFVNENEKVTGPILNISKGDMYLINCTENFITTDKKINIKGNGNAHLENSQFSVVNVNANAKLYLSGNNEITANICATATQGSSLIYPQIIVETTNAKAVNTPVALTFDDAATIAALDKPFITGTTDISMFSLPDGLGYKLEPNADNTGLILKTKVQSGVEDVMAEDADAPVEWFNLQGIRVANPENGIYIRRQGSKVEKVVL